MLNFYLFETMRTLQTMRMCGDVPKQCRLPSSLRNGIVLGMTVTQIRRCAGILPLMLMLSACGALDPYVYNPNEFDRQSAGFNLDPSDISEVSICYQSLVTDRESVVALAEERCRAFDRSAELLGTGYGYCPLLTLTRARFACVRS